MTLEEIKAKIAVANENEKKGNYDLAEVISKEVVLSLQSLNQTHPIEGTNNEIIRQRNIFEAEALMILAYCSLKKGDDTLPIKFTQDTLQIAEKHNLSSIKAKCLNFFGIIYKFRGEFNIALDYYFQALIVNEELGYKSNLALINGNIGNVYTNLGLSDKALEYYSKTLSIHEELGEKSYIALDLGNIGVIYDNLGSFELALDFYTKSLSIFEELKEVSSIARLTGNIGSLYFTNKYYENAIEYFTKAYTLSEELGEKREIATWLTGIGSALSSMKKLSEAKEYLLKALYLFRIELQSNEGMIDTLISIGNLYLQDKNFEEAKHYFEEALQLSTLSGQKRKICNSLKALAEIFRKLGKWKKADSHFLRFYELEKELQSEDAKNKAQQFDQRRKIEEDERNRQVKLARFQEQERIFHNILPISIANRLIDGETTIAESYENVSIFFSDIVGFTALSSKISPKKLVNGLNHIFTTFDRIATKYGLEKIKTIGDAYMAVCGVPTQFEDHAIRSSYFAIEVSESLQKVELGPEFQQLSIRMGLHSGSVVAGIIGEKKFAFDVWGDSVNIASRMESHGEPKRIHCSDSFAKLLDGNLEFTLIPRGEITIKGKGTMNTYWLEKRK